MILDTDKRWIRELVGICYQRGVRKIVMSPGSRCAPLVIAFNRHPGIECISIVDERSAAFVALGMAQQLQQPVALLCTSGTATLNYAPALAEAYYQRIPLLVLTADRPPELIDKGDGQTIRQHNIYHNYIKHSYQLPVEATDDVTLQLSNLTVAEAIDATQHPDMGPVHINIPLREPLYGLKEYEDHLLNDEPIGNKAPNSSMPALAEQFLAQWQQAHRRMIVIGGHMPTEALNQALAQLNTDPSTVIIAETTANVTGPNILHCPDATLAVLNPKEADSYFPDMVVTLGGGLVSKKLKTLLRQSTQHQHWHLDATGMEVDTFNSPSFQVLAVDPVDCMQWLASQSHVQTTNYLQLWLNLQAKAQTHHHQLLQTTGYNDLKVFEVLLQKLPINTNLHLGNSTPVRYAGLFTPRADVAYNCNRGTSGIDGVVSTAVGAAMATGKPTTVITGDVAFFYDSNALWNQQLPSNLRIIIINNGGGNIFRVLNGSSQLPELEPFFETKMDLNARHLAQTFGLPYYFCDNLTSLEEIFPVFFEPHDGKCVILEIKTPGPESAAAMRNYLGL